MSIKNLILILLIIIVFFCGCMNVPGKQEKADDVQVLPYQEVVLSIGALELTSYEVEKNFKQFQANYLQKEHRLPGDSAINNWKREFIDRNYLLADAYVKGYTEHSDIKMQTNSMARFMIGQPGGVLEKRTEHGPLDKRSVSFNTVRTENDPQLQKQNETQKIVTILEKAEFHTNGMNLYLLADQLKKQGEASALSEERLKNILSSNLATYKFNSAERKISVRQLVNFYNNLPMRQAIRDDKSIRLYLEGMVLDEYFYQQAEQLGITKDPKFILDKQNYKNALISKLYSRNELTIHPIITEQQLKIKYKSIQKQFIAPQEIISDLYYFTNIDSALNAVFQLRRATAKPLYLSGLKAVQKHVKIKYNSTLPDTLKKMIAMIPDGGVLRPVKIGNDHVVAWRISSSGTRIRTFDEVRKELIEQIESDSMKVRIQQRLIQLKHKYKMIDKIDSEKLAITGN